MAKKATITPVTDTVNNAAAINTQLNAINNQLDNTLSLDGSVPNAMGADIDMNSNDLLNVRTLQTNDITVAGDSLVGVLASTGANKDAAAASAASASTSATAASTSATAASLSATQAAQYDGIWLDDVATLLADTTLTYTVGQPSTVVVGDYVRTRKEGFAYQVATVGDVTTAGSIQLDVLADASGYNVKAFGAVGDGTTDDTAAIQGAAASYADLYFPPVPNGSYYKMLTGDLVLASTASPRNDVRLVGAHKGNNGPETTSIKFGSGYGLKVNGTSGAYCLFRLVTKDLFFGPIDSVSRTTPIFDITGLAYWDRDNCHFQGDTLKEQPVVRMRWSLGLTSRVCNIWGGLTGEDFGTAADPMNVVDCFGDNHNGSRWAGKYACTSFKKVGGAVQSCGDGFDFSGQNAESSSGVIVQGVYFENNKFWSGSAFTGRDITIGGAVFVRGATISGNYHAQLTSDNAFTSGQGASTLPPISITRLQGGSIVDNFWNSVSGSAYVELEHVNQAGTRFPNNLSIQGNTDLYTAKAASVAWGASVIESQKFAIMANDSIVIRDWTEKTIGVTKTVRSPQVNITATGTVTFPIMESLHYGQITAIRLVCSDSFSVAATLNIGVLASATFYSSSFSLASKSAYTTTTVTQNNTKIDSTNGPIIGSVNTTVLTTPGAFMIEIDYNDVLE